MTEKTSSPSKTTVFNLIILDESGSMSGIVEQTLSGCNETINVVKSTAEANPDKIRSFVSIYAFQSNPKNPSHYLIKNASAAEVRHITRSDYSPYGGTPLLDAVGSTLSELKAVAATHENSTGIVTIITDGYENASRHYTWQSVGALISELKEIGWTINLIGANIDVDQMAKHINVENTMSFDADEEGTEAMYMELKHNMHSRYCELSEEDASMPMSARLSLRKEKARNFFKH